MRNKISALIIDNNASEHNYNDIVFDNLPEWFEKEFDINVISDRDNIISSLNKYKGFDVLISIGNVNVEILNDFSFEIRKKWIHIDSFDKNEITNIIVDVFLNNINRDRGDEKLFSIFTSMYNTTPKQIKRLYQSLLNQTYHNWNWWIIDDSNNYNTSDVVEKLHDPRIHVFKNVTNHGNIGFNKHMIAMMCDGDYLVEVDHDDELVDVCLEKLYEAFQKSDADFVYSDALEIIDNMPIYYDEYFSYGQGYYRDEEINGEYVKNIAITCRNINVKSVRGIHALPNHVRCWKKTFYHKIGGHNMELSVLDDMDLLIRTFLQGKMAKVDKVLYIQHQGVSRENGRGNTATGARVKEIQRLNSMLKWKYEQAIHDRILELGFNDPIWDDKLNESNLEINLSDEQLVPMDVLIIK